MSKESSRYFAWMLFGLSGVLVALIQFKLGGELFPLTFYKSLLILLTLGCGGMGVYLLTIKNED